jgi:2-methylcitrate dehydratase PrpD
MTDEQPPGRRLGEFAAGLESSGLPAAVVHAARRALVDWVAAALLGSSDPGSAKLRRVVASLDDRGPATVVGSPVRTSVPLAALANGFASHALDFDDVFNPPVTTVHLGSCIWPSVLAIAEDRALSGSDLVASFVAGYEVGVRVATAAGVTHFESGWQVTGTAGALAASAAASRARRLDAEQTTSALGMAAAQASGIREVYGSDAKALQPGRAAMSGVLNSLMAGEGMTSRPTALEGRQGLLGVISRDPRPDELVRDLGDDWRVLENGHKLYPNASLTHPAIDAALAVVEGQRFDPSMVASIEVRMLPFAASVTSDPRPASSSRARFSVEHCVAEVLRTGRLDLQSFATETLRDPVTERLRACTTVVPDGAVGKRGARVTVTMADGTTLQRQVSSNRGTPDNPLSDQELVDKLEFVARGRIPDRTTAELLELVWGLDRVADAAVLPPLLATEPLEGWEQPGAREAG